MRKPARAGVTLVSCVIATLATGTAVTTAASNAAPSRLDGYTAASSANQRAVEKQFLNIPSRSVARSLDKDLANKTGMVGTLNDKRRMQKIVGYLKSYGLQPKVHKYYVYMSTPKKISLQMTSPVRYTAPNKEKCRAVETDCQDVVVGYNALSPSGDVTAPVVYANYGTTDDYAALARAGVSVKNKIVLTRYGAVYRGVKTNLAAEHGAKGVIIYSDPADDGNTNGPVYPAGPWRAPDGIQRGSVQQLWKYGGDPLTPGRPATKDARRIAPSKSNIAKIPTTPIGYGAAKPILEHLGGSKAPKAFQGGLPLTYRLGSGSTVHLDLDIRYSIKPVYDVTATIPGTVHPDEIVQVGAHHDAWTYGSDDNLSGAEAILQMGRAFGTMLRSGWEPSRTIRLGTWDGEEYGLFGSTEYAEDTGTSKPDKIVAYLNMDGAGGENFGASSVPSVDGLIRDVAGEVKWPGTNGTALDNWAKNSGEKTPTPERLGSGSDYTAFLDHFGVPAFDIGSGTASGNYHCACDNYYMESHYIDPGFRYHVATSKVVGLAVLRMAGADVMPLHYQPYADEVGTYLNDLTAQQNEVFGQEVVPLDAAKRQAQNWSDAAVAIQKRIDAALDRGASASVLDGLTRQLEGVERALLTNKGLPGRPWFRHQIYAPGVNQGYGTQELPAVNDALFLRNNTSEARNYARQLTVSLRAAAQTLG